MKKINGWIIIGICILAIAAAAGLIVLIGQLGPETIPGTQH